LAEVRRLLEGAGRSAFLLGATGSGGAGSEATLDAGITGSGGNGGGRTGSGRGASSTTSSHDARTGIVLVLAAGAELRFLRVALPFFDGFLVTSRVMLRPQARLVTTQRRTRRARNECS
jgi:hypothetical protein